MSAVLVTEDNAANRELLRELLEMRGHTVVEACNGLEALALMAQSLPDIVLLDMGMPVMDGYEVLRKIREDARLARLPVLAVTAYAMQGDREQILEAGFDGYLSKPINSRVLSQELERLLGGRTTIGKGRDKSRAAQAGGDTDPPS